MYHSRRGLVLLLAVIVEVNVARLEKCTLNNMDCETTEKEICCDCFENSTEKHEEKRTGTYRARNSTQPCGGTGREECALSFCRQVMGLKEQGTTREILLVDQSVCSTTGTKPTAACHVCCTCTIDFCKTTKDDVLSEATRVAIICITFGFFLLLFMVCITHRRRQPRIFGVIFFNNSEPSVSLLSRRQSLVETGYVR